QPPLDQRAAGLLRLDNRGPSRIDEDRALHTLFFRHNMSPAAPTYKRIHFVASPIPEAQEALARLTTRYGEVAADAADAIVPPGGDGLMLQPLHRFMRTGKPIYGMHRGTVGFLMNEFADDELPKRLAKALVTVIHPLLMRAHDEEGETIEFHAFNEVSL